MEVLAVSPAIRDAALREYLTEEVLWLRRLVEDGLTDAKPDLVAALRACAGRNPVRPLDVRLDIVEGSCPQEVPAAAVEAITGAVTEALTNAAKHSGCPQATVRVSANRGMLVVTVADNGHGIASGGLAGRGFGVTNSISGRMTAVGGTGIVYPAPGGGTVVELTLPADRMAGNRP